MTDKMAGPARPTPGATCVLNPLDHDQMTLTGGWLGEWQQRNAAATLPHVLSKIMEGEAASNLARLAGESSEPFRGMPFTDSDVYKLLEAVAWQAPFMNPDDPVLRGAAHLVELLQRVQEPDGYLNSNVQGSLDIERWSDPHWGHELYCAGHLFQAAVAAMRTGSLPGLEAVALRFAYLLVERFSGDADTYVEGHPEVETALVELYRQTGEPAYLELASEQVEARGHGWLGEQQFGSAYFQDHRPVRDGAEATGHAVRQLYLLTGALDVATETGDAELLGAVIRTWEDLFATKTYVTGAHGSRHRDEAIGDPYELPSDRAYAETCAAVASFQLSWRLLLATGDARYADEMEHVLYNAIAVSTGRDGTSFFYSNPLHLRTGHVGDTEDAPGERLPWYACACCPPNIARLLATAHDYLVTTSSVGVQVHQHTPATVDIAINDRPVRLRIDTAYPWDGVVTVEVDHSGDTGWELALRVPAWCSSATVAVDGVPVETSAVDGYVRLARNWNGTHTVTLRLFMPVRTIRPHPRIDAARGCVAVARGPVLYAVESVDLPDGVVLEDIRLKRVTTETVRDSDVAPVLLLGVADHTLPPTALYEDASASGPVTTANVPLTLVPYHRWGNRGPGAMRVWIPTASSELADTNEPRRPRPR